MCAFLNVTIFTFDVYIILNKINTDRSTKIVLKNYIKN